MNSGDGSFLILANMTFPVLRRVGSPPSPGCASLPTMAKRSLRALAERRAVTIEDIAASRGVSVHTIRFDRSNNPAFPPPVGTRCSSRPGRRCLEYDATAIADFYRGREAANPQARTGPRQPIGTWPADERVDARTAAARLGVSVIAVRSYPSVYPAGSRNPFPARLADGRYRWGDIETWDARRPGSGRRRARA